MSFINWIISFGLDQLSDGCWEEEHSGKFKARKLPWAMTTKDLGESRWATFTVS